MYVEVRIFILLFSRELLARLKRNVAKTAPLASASLGATTLLSRLIEFQVESNLGSRTHRIMNSSVYEQNFRTQSVSDDVLCLELRTRKPSTSWSDKLGVSASAVFVEE